MPCPRLLTALLLSRLKARPAVTLTGARQTGKTTLAKTLLSGPATLRYLSLDHPEVRLDLARDPLKALHAPAGTVVVLDEIQKMPSLLDAVKFLIDEKAGPKFLLLGSAQILLLKQVRETLAGRTSLLELWPLSLAERAGEAPCALEPRIRRIWAEGIGALSAAAPSGESRRVLRAASDEALRWGGYPALLSIPDGAGRSDWLSDYRRTYLERDLLDLGRVADLDQFALAQKLLAVRTACLLSASEVSRDLGVAVSTVQRFLRYLEISYQVHLLRPFHANITKRLVRSPKFYWADVGMARFLAEREGLEDGAMYETHVLGELLKWRSSEPIPPDLFFYRTQAGLEVDFLVKGPRRALWIEAKAARRVGPPDASSIRRVMKEHRLPGAIGLVVYRGEEAGELSEGIWAVPDSWLFGNLSPS